MDGAVSQHLVIAEVVLAAHVAVIGFNLFGLIVVPIGLWRRWSFVRAPTWRLLHLASFAVVAIQAVAGKICFLTVWEDELLGAKITRPLIVRWVNGLIFWPLPLWIFNAIYLALFAYALALLWLAPLDWNPGRKAQV